MIPKLQSKVTQVLAITRDIMNLTELNESKSFHSSYENYNKYFY